MPTKTDDLPGALKSSPRKAQRTHAVTGRSKMAVEELARAIARKQG